jgi:small subunit ribosomal protein S17
MERGMRKEWTGVVVSDKMQKTSVVEIQTWKTSPIYGKRIRSTHRVKAHDENNETGVGDTVRLVECRPLSRDKKWRIASIIEKSRMADLGGDRK